MFKLNFKIFPNIKTTNNLNFKSTTNPTYFLINSPFKNLNKPFFTPTQSILSRRNFSNSSFKSRSYYGKQQQQISKQPQWIRKFNQLPTNTILYTLIGLNLAVFGTWQIAEKNAMRFRDGGLINFMDKNFTTSIRNLQEGRVWTLITSSFSHSGTGHILANMLTLYFMAGPVIGILGNVGFITVYLGGGLACSTISLFVHRFLDKYPNRNYSSHGASGAVYSTLVFFACAMPTTTFLIMFVIPVPAWLCVTGLIGYDTYTAIKQPGGKTDSAGHLGGAFAGFLFFLRTVGRI